MESKSDKERYKKLNSMVMESTKYVRRIFQTRWEKETGAVWVPDEDHIKKFQDTTLKTAFKALDSVQKKRVLNSHGVSAWDMTLAAAMTTNLGSDSSYETENKAVVTLRNIRNSLTHRSPMLVGEDEFSEKVDILRNCLCVLGGDPKSIEKLIEYAGITSPIDAAKALAVLHQSASAHLKENRLKEAETCFTKGLEIPCLSPVSLSRAYEKRAEFYLIFGNNRLYKRSYLALAEVDLINALFLYEASAGVHYLLAKCQRFRGNTALAIFHYKRSLNIFPADGNVKSELESFKQLAGIFEKEDHPSPFRILLELQRRLQEVSENLCGQSMSEEGCQLQEEKSLSILGKNYASRGLKYCMGLGCSEVRSMEGVRYIEEAAKLGNIEGLFYLAECYHYGCGVNKDVSKALAYYSKVASTDPATISENATENCNLLVGCAQYMMGIIWENSITTGVHFRFRRAASLYKFAMEKGIPNAAHNLAILHYYGLGVPENRGKAEMCWKTGVELNDATSAGSLLVYYMRELEPQRASDIADKIGKDFADLLTQQMLVDEFRREEQKIRKQRDMLEPAVQLVLNMSGMFETCQKLDSENLTFRQRFTRMLAYFVIIIFF